MASEVAWIVQTAETPVVSAQYVADEMEMSRQYANRELNEALEQGELKRVQIGPSYAWYSDSNWEEQLEKEFEGIGLSPHPIVCNQCPEWTEEGDRILAWFEKLDPRENWDMFDIVCSEHVEHPLEAREEAARSQILKESLSDYDTSFAFVELTVGEEVAVQDDGREVEWFVGTDPDLVELIRPFTPQE